MSVQARIRGSVPVSEKKFYTGYIEVPGITAAAAHAAGDALGDKFTFDVPISGTITVAVLLDKDDEGIELDLVLFTNDFTATADDSAFAISDVDLENFLTTITFATFKNYANNQTSAAAALGLDYLAPKRKLWAQVVTRGASTIAAANMPMISLTGVSDE